MSGRIIGAPPEKRGATFAPLFERPTEPPGCTSLDAVQAEVES